MRAGCAILPSNWLEKKNGMKNNSGFTLVELIAVIAILAVLLAAAAPRAAGLIQGARHSAAVSDARITAGAVQRYLYDVKEEGRLNVRTLHQLMGSQLDDPEGPLAEYLSGGLSDARVLSADVNLRIGWLEELVYENEDTQVKLTFAEDGTAVVEEITDK